jgi:hypothetical protein
MGDDEIILRLFPWLTQEELRVIAVIIEAMPTDPESLNDEEGPRATPAKE